MSLITTTLATLSLLAAPAPHGKAFMFQGEYVEGCGCMGVCPCELTGVNMSCEGVGGIRADHATYNGMDISGMKSAYALVPGKWVIIYMDAPADKMAASTEFMKAALAGFGPVESVKPAHITLDGSNGTYMLKVDDGKIMSLKTEPVIGGDSKNPMVYNNIHDVLHPTIMQGKTVEGSFMDGDHSFTLKDSNAFFNNHIRTHGEF